MPASSRSGVGYSVYQRTPSATTWGNSFGVTEALQTHFLVAGKDTSTQPNTSITFEAAFLVDEAFNFDQKFDDGIASDGKIRVHADSGAYNITCTTGATPNYSYHMTDTDSICSIMQLFLP